MKLIYCPICQDVVRLMGETRVCKCGGSRGRYIDKEVAVIDGTAIPIGIANSSLREALENRPLYGRGSRFEAFVIPHDCVTVISVEEANAIGQSL